MGAVGEGVAVSAAGCADLGGAGGAGRGVGGDAGLGPAAAAGSDLEAVGEVGNEGRHFDRVHPGQCRGAGGEGLGEGFDPLAGGLDPDPLGVVPDPTLQAHLLGELPDEGAEADPLDLAADPDQMGGPGVSRGRHGKSVHGG